MEDLESLKGKKGKQKKFLEAIAKYKAAQQVAGAAAADVCPITHKPFVNKVKAADGQLVLRSARHREVVR